VQREADYLAVSEISPLRFERIYNGSEANIDRNIAGGVGSRWSHSYGTRLTQELARVSPSCFTEMGNNRIICVPSDPSTNSAPPAVAVTRPDGKTYRFTQSGPLWLSDSDVNDRVAELRDSSNMRTGWIYSNAAGDVKEHFDADGKLTLIASRNGSIQRLTYSTGNSNDTNTARHPADAPVCKNLHPGSVIPAGRLLCVTDQFGRQLNFEYDAEGKITKLIDPASLKITYAYNGPSSGCPETGSTSRSCMANNLTKVTYPDAKSRTYFYNEASKINGGTNCPISATIGNGYGHLLNSLTGIEDENDIRYATWEYDCHGRATASEHAGGVERVQLSYGTIDSDGNSTTIVTHSIGTIASPQTTVRQYTYRQILGVAKNTGVDGPCVECGLIKRRAHDANGNISSKIDWNDIQTTYRYDLNRNLETSRVEASGTPQARTITTQWHPTYRLPTLVAGPLRRTRMEHDAKGNVLTKTVHATADATGASGAAAPTVGVPRAWRYTYNGVGQVLTATGPRTDVGDKTTYAYDDITGNLMTVTNAAGHITTLSNYDANGRVGKIVDANGLAIDLQYTPRGWLKSRTVTGNGGTETTGYEYDGVGQLKKVTLPDGSWIGYDYDAAHRLTDTYDRLGNRITYTLDAMGNRLKEQVTDPSGALARQITRVYDALNRLQTVTGASL